MVDIVDKATRSRMMSGIRSKNTTPEIVIRSMLHRAGFRFALQRHDLPGKPDLALPKYGAVIFVHGCFWHGHDCENFKWPSTNPAKWRAKILGNQKRDLKQVEALLALGWRVAIVWECAVRGSHVDLSKICAKLVKWLHGNRRFREIQK